MAIPASAQVYSANIVGYYNVPTPGNLTAMTVSLKTGANRADEVIPYTAGDNIQVWNGAGWDMFVMDPASATKWSDKDENAVPLANLPTLSLGKGFFYGKSSALTSVTIVGEVLKGTNTVIVGTGLQAAGSQLPVGGDVNAAGDATISGVNLQLPNGSNVQLWTGTGWNMFVRDPAAATGWSDKDENPVAAPTVSVGQGFFIGNLSPGTFNWQQWYNY